MDVSIPNMTETIQQQSINPVQEANLQTKKISLDELAKATETLKKYIYQHKKEEVRISENKPIANEIQLAEQPVINSDALTEETPLVYENVSTAANGSEQIAEIPLTQDNTVENEIDTVISIPVATNIQSDVPIIQPQIANEEVSNILTNGESVMEPVVQSEPQIIDNSITVDNFSIPENISIPTLDGMSQTVVSEPVDNSSYVATSNIATVNSDYSNDVPEVIPVTMPDGQFIQENIGEESLVTSPQSFGMM